MQLLTTDWRYGTPRPELGTRSLRPLFALTLAVAAAGATIGGQSAFAAVDENWAGDAIRHMQSEHPGVGQRRRHRGSAGERTIPATTGSGRSAARP
jgi:hypothetical protein